MEGRRREAGRRTRTFRHRRVDPPAASRKRAVRTSFAAIAFSGLLAAALIWWYGRIAAPGP